MPPALERVLYYIDKATPAVMKSGLLGIDIGTSSIKLVQISLKSGTPVLETFGELDVSGSLAQSGRADAHTAAEGILDLEQSVDATARSGGLAIPLDSVLLFTAETPHRDEEQMRHILPSEVRRFIPVPLESVTLDWQVIDEKRQKDAFEGGASKPAAPLKQTILVAAVKNTAMDEYRVIASKANVQNPYFEIEAFSAARACGKVRSSNLLLDFGATTTKLYCLNERGFIVGSHVVRRGGESITESIRLALNIDFAHAESIKRSCGPHGAAELTAEENTKVAHAIDAALTSIRDDILHALDEFKSANPWRPESVQLCGGGALLSGIAPYLERFLSMPSALVQPFEHVRTPMILEREIKEIGPKYAVAVGIALRGLRG